MKTFFITEGEIEAILNLIRRRRYREVKLLFEKLKEVEDGN